MRLNEVTSKDRAAIKKATRKEMGLSRKHNKHAKRQQSKAVRKQGKMETALSESINIMLFEALKLLHDKKNGVLAVASDETDAKKASQETYRNKDALKKVGFKWSGGNWNIDDSKLEDAKRALSQINKTEYIIDKLEDVQEFIGDATADPKKDILVQKIDDYIQELAGATDEAAAAAEIKNYLNFLASFHQYSFYNRILIYIQNPKASRVASYKNWREKHRQVKKGSKGMKVLFPRFAKGDNPKYEDVPEDEKAQPVGFGVGTVFDIADTEAIDERGNVPDEPEWWGDNSPSETAEELYTLVLQAAEAEGIDVTADDAKGGEKGYSSGGHINITSDVEGVGKVSTMIHEWGHELMHWKDRSKFYVGDGTSSAVKELQAESVSYVVLKHYDLPVEHHTKYLALWKASGDRIKNNVEVISRTAHYIIGKIDAMAEKSNKPVKK